MGRSGWGRSNFPRERIIFMTCVRPGFSWQSIRALRISIAAALGALVSGCIGIGHIKVDVSPVTVEFTQAAPETPAPRSVELACLQFMGESDAFVSLLNSSAAAGGTSRDWHRAEMKGQPLQFKCPGEMRYIGFPAVPLIPLAPSREESKSRRFFVRADGSDQLFRIAIVGRAATVTQTDLDRTRSSVPPSLLEPIPRLGSPQQTELFLERVRLSSEFYRGVPWRRSEGLEVIDIKTSDSGDILAIRIRLK